jgi:phenylpropionate dioxygenase-like ring-hydroxylating dioxygenase large terminal subunit
MTPAAPSQPWWVPAAAAAEVGTAAALAVRAWDEEFVLWRTREGAPQCFVDRCPHRGARLSMGRIVEGEALECAYHGWRFGSGGACTRIPALPQFTPTTQHATAWPAREQHGLVWIAAPSATEQRPFGPEALEGLPARRVLCGPFDAATSAPRVVENFLDTAHFGIVHEGWLGSREQLAVPDYRVDRDEHGRPEVHHYRAWQPRASALAAGGAWVSYSYRVLSPYAALLTKRADGTAPEEAYALWTCPLGEEHTRVWFTLATSDTTRSDAELRDFQATIFGQDAPVLESQRPRRLPLARGAELHCAADRLSVAYRRWLGEQGALFGTC